MVLHDLCHAINKCGHRASIALIHGGSADKQSFNYGYSNDEKFYNPNGLHFHLDESNISEQVGDILVNGTVIYPDLIVGNPLNARRVIRYVLNKNLASHGSDYVLVHSKLFSEKYNFSLPKMFLDANINSEGGKHWTERTLNLTYIGKGNDFESCYRISGSLLVERDWPRDKEQLGLLLRQCKFFFTWDCVSATNVDAVLCGAVPILLHDKQINRAEINCSEFGAFPDMPFRFNGVGGITMGDLTADKIAEVDLTLRNMIVNVAQLDNSWESRVGQFLNDYILFMCSQQNSLN